MNSALLLVPQVDGSTHEVALDAERTLLGRGADCDVVLTGYLISRHHACITRSNQTYMLEDLGSRNGTTVNNQALTARHVLRDGDRIALGGVGSLLFVDSEATRTRPLPRSSGVWLDVAGQDVWIDGHCLRPPLSPAQWNFVQMLMAARDHVCSRDMIVAAVWPDAVDGVSDEAIDGLIKRVRSRFSEVPDGERYLVTIRGRGLMLRSHDIPR